MKTVIAPLTDNATGTDSRALPAEWAQWAEEPGQGVQVEDGGALLGTLHAVIVGRDEAWCEGLWVEPSARGRGVGRRLVTEAEKVVRGYGAAIMRTAVPARDYGALAVAERTGFTRHSEAGVVIADIPQGPLDLPYEAPVAPALPEDARAIIGLTETAPQLTDWGGLVPLGWRFRRLVPELLLGLIKDERVLRTGEAGGGSGGRGGLLCHSGRYGGRLTASRSARSSPGSVRRRGRAGQDRRGPPHRAVRCGHRRVRGPPRRVRPAPLVPGWSGHCREEVDGERTLTAR